MKTVSLKTTLLAAALSFSSIFVNGLGNVMAQNAKDWYASQSITMLDKKAYKEITRSFRKKNSVKLAFHFEKCQWNIQRSVSYEFFKDSVNLRDLMDEFEDVVVSKSGISKGEILPPHTQYAQSDFTLHVLIKRVSKDAGISANGLIVYRDSIPLARIDLSVEDGRWNDFSTLFIENGEKMGKNLRQMIRMQKIGMLHKTLQRMIKQRITNF